MLQKTKRGVVNKLHNFCLSYNKFTCLPILRCFILNRFNLLTLAVFLLAKLCLLNAENQITIFNFEIFWVVKIVNLKTRVSVLREKSSTTTSKEFKERFP